MDVLQYLQEGGGQQSVKKIDDRTNEVLEIIRRRPRIYQYSKKGDCRRCVLTKQTSLFYRLKPREEQIQLLLFWDNRRNINDLDLTAY